MKPATTLREEVSCSWLPSWLLVLIDLQTLDIPYSSAQHLFFLLIPPIKCFKNVFCSV
ncbi:hypothetical protein AOLI_G00157270 [Acnodon oligacanthus]